MEAEECWPADVHVRISGELTRLKLIWDGDSRQRKKNMASGCKRKDQNSKHIVVLLGLLSWTV